MSSLTCTDLLELKYPALQLIAKIAGVKTNAKKNVVVDLLSRRFPDGVPRHIPRIDIASASKNQSPTPINASIKKRESKEDDCPRPLKRQRRSPSPENNPVTSWIEDVRSAKPSPVINSPSAMTPPRPRSTSPAPALSPFPHVYCFKGARRICRKLVTLVNGTAAIHVELDEGEALLNHAMKITDETSREVHGLVYMNHAMQFMYRAMKRDRTILDGTHLLDSPHRQAWKAYANEADRLKQQALDEWDEKLYNEQVELNNASFGAQMPS